MRVTLKKLLALLATLAVIFMLVSCEDFGNSSSEDYDATPGSNGEIVIGFSQVGAESDWRTANTKSMRETFSKENGYYLIFDDAQNQQDKQITAIRNYIQQEVDYIVLAPTTEAGWDTVLQEAKDANIPVIIVDRMIDVSDESLYTCWVGSDFYAEGLKAVEWLEEEFDEEEVLNIAHLQGSIGSSAQIGRTQGIEEGVAANPNWHLVAQQTGDFTQAKGQEVMESILKNNSDINVVYSENDNMAFGAIDAIEAAGKTCGTDGDIVIISFDTTNAGLTLTLEGKISYNVECNPLHGPRVEALIRQLENGETPQKQVFVNETTFDARTITQEIIDKRDY